MAVKFQPKPGKPHIRLMRINTRNWILSPVTHADKRKLTSVEKRLHSFAYNYCIKVNPHYCKTKGEAARALHYGSTK